jgi:CTP:phosphocholine cytidylyltransferase-like protein
MTINGGAQKNILGENFEPLPSKVIINGKEQNNIKRDYGLSQGKNNITLIFNESIESCEKMFYGLTDVLELDLLLSNPNLIRKYEYSSNFLGVPVDRTDDWCFEVKNGIITKQRIGSINCYQMIGISYYTSKDGKQLSKDLEEVYLSPGGKEKYWDQVPLEIKKQNYEMNVRECKSEDIIEIDTFNELKAIDKTYDV